MLCLRWCVSEVVSIDDFLLKTVNFVFSNPCYDNDHHLLVVFLMKRYESNKNWRYLLFPFYLLFISPYLILLLGKNESIHWHSEKMLSQKLYNFKKRIFRREQYCCIISYFWPPCLESTFMHIFGSQDHQWLVILKNSSRITQDFRFYFAYFLSGNMFHTTFDYSSYSLYFHVFDLFNC